MSKLRSNFWWKVTVGVVGATVVVLVVYDVVAVVKGGVDATISAVIADAAREYPVIPLAFGVLMGHFFWPVRKMSVAHRAVMKNKK